MVEEVMRDNLELMLEIVMRIREDPDFASNIYAECPRLQHLLDLNPDLRPIFEDPYLVRLNFEKVYRDAGGILPEDKPPKKSLLATIVSHPLFKVFRFLLIIKKLMNCIMGGGMAMLRTMFCGLCFDDLAELADTPDADDHDNPHDSNPENQENKEALNKAADHMEDPEVQGRMNEMLAYDDPERLEEAIDNDPELRALRDSNPLCRELMSDPETMRILVEPENLRALGDCPDMIEQDFSDPDWSPPDVENGASGDAAGDAFHSGGLRTIGEVGGEGVDADVDADAAEDDGAEKQDGKEEGMELEMGDEETGKDEGMELEMGDEDVHREEGMEYEMGEDNGRDDGMEFELGDDDVDNDRPNSANKSKGAQKKQQDKKKSDGKGGFLHNIGVGITDMVAAELVGVAVSDVMGGDDEFAGLEDAADEAAEDVADDVAEEASDAAAEAAASAAVAAELLMNDDITGNLEDGMDHVEDTHEEHKEDREYRQNAAVGAAAGGAVGVGFVAGDDNDRDIEAGDEEEEVVEEEEKKKSRFGFIGTFASAVSTAAKEMVASELLGDDFGEQLVEKIEEDEEESEDDGSSSKDSDKDDEETEEKEEEKETKEKRGLFRKRRDGV
jgi:hypothetical protein